MRDFLDRLLAVAETPKLTLQIPAATDRAARDLGIRHQLETARARLADVEIGAEEAAGLVEQADRLAHRRELATARRGTAGIYVAAGFGAAQLWPASLPERMTVGDEFFVTDIVGLASTDHCFVLELTRGGAALFRADSLVIEEVPLPDAPSGLAEVTEHLDPERQLQFHQSQRVGRSGTAAPYHGHGIGEGRDVEEVKNYLRAVDRSVRGAIVGEGAPIALVGSDDLPALFASVSTLARLVADVDHHHPVGVTETRLRKIADQLLEQRSKADVSAARDDIHSSVAAGRGSVNLQATVSAALRGRVATLLVGRDLGGSDTAVNTAVVATMRRRGQVLPDPDLPEDTPVAALFRY